MKVVAENVCSLINELEQALHLVDNYNAGEISKWDVLRELSDASNLAYYVDAYYKFNNLDNPMIGKYYLSDLADNFNVVEMTILQDGVAI